LSSFPLSAFGLRFITRRLQPVAQRWLAWVGLPRVQSSHHTATFSVSQPTPQEPTMITSLKLNAILSNGARATSLAMATVLTIGLLLGVNGLATGEAQSQEQAQAQVLSTRA
jgi:hypothetical protein